MAERVMLIDGHGYLHRAFHALPAMYSPSGQMVNAVYGFSKMLLKFLREDPPRYVAVCFDAPGPTRRHGEYPEYKATRVATDEGLVAQFPLSRELVAALGLAGIEESGYEADDLIAALARKAEAAGLETVIVSGDKDLLQIVNGHVRVLNEARGILYGPEEVRARYGVEAGKILDVLALAGDSSDNVPGVRGVGEKTAIKLVQRFGSVEGLYDRLDEVEGALRGKLEASRDLAFLSKRLITLSVDAPVPADLEKLRPGPPGAGAEVLFQRLGFRTLLAELKSGEHKAGGEDSAPAIGAAATTPASAHHEARYTTILTEVEWRKVLEQVRSVGVLALDTETTGLSPRQARLVGISLSARPREAVYIPVGHADVGAPAQLPLPRVLEDLRPILENPGVKKIGQNLKFDFQILDAAGIRLRGMHFDTMLASYVLNPARMTHRLGDLAVEYLGETKSDIEDLIGRGKAQIAMDLVPIERAGPYACADADLAYRLWQRLAPELEQGGVADLFHQVEMPLVEVLAAMESAGILVDREALQRMGHEFEEAMAKLETDVHRVAGEPFNLNSTRQLADILFTKFRLPVIRRTKTGVSTDEEVLRELAPSHELPGLILSYRELQKLTSTYVRALEGWVDPATGRVHTSFRQAVTATGRLSSADPNLQNIPIRGEHGRRIRRAFVAPQGRRLLSADYSQIDLRSLAHISGDAAMCEAFHRGEDIHRRTAGEIFHVPVDAVDEAQRDVAKHINFGIVYGISAYGLSQQLGIPQSEARAYIDRYLERYGGVKEWMAGVVREAEERGFVTTLLGRRRSIPELSSRNPARRGEGERMALNTPIQGTSADIIKVAMIRLHRRLQREQPEGRMLLQVHDELVLEVPEKDIARAAEMVREEMEHAVKLSVPLVVDLKVGENWGGMAPYA